MIIGNGLLASAFRPYFQDAPEIVVFASGVSNSRETHELAFLRERDLLMEALDTERFFLYLSTCSVDDPELLETPYVIHKQQMESLVRTSRDYAIFRLPQVVGTTHNPNTLTNYLYNQIVSGTHFQIWRHAKRNLIDVDDVAPIVAHLLKTCPVNRTTTNVACPFSVSILQLVATLELVTGKRASYEIVETGGLYIIDSSIAVEAASQIGIVFDESYIEHLIRKYYGS